MGATFFPNLAGPDGILILLIVLLLFGARNIPTFMRGMDQARREFFGNEDEDEPEITRRRTVQPPHLAIPPLISRSAAPFLILILLIALGLFLIWQNHGP
jgi:sec-independent protein translocase protein TatA